MSSKPRFAAHLAEDLPPEDFQHVLGLVRDEVASLTALLAAAAVAGDVMEFRKAAHGIAGSAGAVGADDLEQAARRAMTEPAGGAGLLAMADEIRTLTAAVLGQIADAFQEASDR